MELSRVEFVPSGVLQFPETHSAIVAGQSMGKAFRERGIAFERDDRQTACRFVLPDVFNRWFQRSGLATVVPVLARVGPQRTPYAQILETYSPGVVWPWLGGKLSTELLDKLQLFEEQLEGLNPPPS